VKTPAVLIWLLYKAAACSPSGSGDDTRMR
jgi:hypothetical protein